MTTSAHRVAHITIAATAAFLVFSSLPASAGCDSGGWLGERARPEAVTGMFLDETGFTAQYWEWGRSFYAPGGSAPVAMMPTPEGLMIARIDWTAADLCIGGSTTPRTLVLFESLSREGGR
jgi:hypothetical protein